MMAQEAGENLNICLVGAGRMGRIRSTLLYANPSATFSVVDLSEKLGNELAKQYHTRYYKTLESAFVIETDCTAVWISTPTFTHEKVIVDALKNDKIKYIFTEKPVGENAEKIVQLFNLCNKKNVKLCCGFQRRFDKSYTDLKQAVQKGKIGDVQMVRVFFADHPVPPIEFLKAGGGDPFTDLAPHDIDFVRWVLNDEVVEVYGTGSSSLAELKEVGIMDNATMLCKFSKGAVCTMMMSRSSTYGYDQRCEFFGTKGMLKVENHVDSSCTLHDNNGVHNAVYKYSFPQRFHEAFKREVNTFINVCMYNESWPVTMNDCVQAQNIATGALKSCESGKMLKLTSSINMSSDVYIRQIGSGSFGTYMHNLLVNINNTEYENCIKLPPYSRSKCHYLDWQRDIINDPNTHAYYICTPDDLHENQTIECLKNGKHVLCEKPIKPNFESVRAACETLSKQMNKELVVMVGFHRRFDAEYSLAKEYLDNWNNNGENLITNILIESFDPVPGDINLNFVVYNSICHDIDLLYFLYGSNAAIDISSLIIENVKESHMIINGIINENISFTIKYKKVHPTYVQQITFNDEKKFGYNYDGTPCCEVYAKAYKNQWKAFLEGIQHVDANANRERMTEYSKTFKTVEYVAKLLAEQL
jgi:myo-inositol 2-dehydrogenase / D-chiro-inositol 1-dehydrogenase